MPDTTAHTHATDEAADTCSICFPAPSAADDPWRPRLYTSAEVKSLQAEARIGERQRIRQHPEVGTIGDGNGHVIRYLVPADLLDGDGDD